MLCAYNLQSPLSAVPKEQSGSQHLVRGVSQSSAPSSPRTAAKDHHEDEVRAPHLLFVAYEHQESEDDEATMPQLAIYDPGELWHVKEMLQSNSSVVHRHKYMPLRKIQLHLPGPDSSVTPVSVTVDDLPIKIDVYRMNAVMEEAALRCDKPAAWYKSPFASIYMVSAESQEQYKSVVRPKLRAWVDAMEPQTRDTCVSSVVVVAERVGSWQLASAVCEHCTTAGCQ
eukprot:12116-Heterococcus_DN1.PRE.2